MTRKQRLGPTVTAWKTKYILTKYGIFSRTVDYQLPLTVELILLLPFMSSAVVSEMSWRVEHRNHVSKHPQEMELHLCCRDGQRAAGVNAKTRWRMHHLPVSSITRFIPAWIRPVNPSDVVVGSRQQRPRGTEGDLWDVGSRVEHAELSPTCTTHEILIPM